MNDFDFDKSFSEDFRKNRMEAPSSEKWQRMEASLRQMKEQKRRKRGIFFLLLPYLLLAGTAGEFVWQRQTSQQLMAGLQGRVTDLEKKLEACGQQSVTNVPETPKEEVSKAKKVNPAKLQPSSPRRSSPFNPAPESIIALAELWQPLVFQGAKTAVAEPVMVIETVAQQNVLADEKPMAEAPPTDTVEAAKTDLTPTPKQRTNRSPLPAQEYAKLASTENNSVEIDAAVKPVFVKKPKEPRGLVIGVTGSHFVPYFRISNPNGKTLGLTAQYRIKKGWCFQAGYNFGRIRYSDDYDYDSTAIYFPPPPAPSYYLKNGTSKQFNSTFHLGVRRYFLLKKRLQPSLALDWVGINRRKGQVEHKWVSLDTTKPAIKTSGTSKIGLWGLSNYQISGALSYRLHPRVELMAQAGLLFYTKNKAYLNKELSYQLAVLGYF